MNHQGRSFKGELFMMLAVAVLLAGCARSGPVRYYQLSVAQGDRVTAEFALPKGITIGLGPVRLPEYLDRPQIVSRPSANSLALADRERWAEPLTDNVARVLSEDLALLLGTDRILLHPWPRSSVIDCQVGVEILRFEAGPDGTVALAARWSVMGKDGKVLLPGRRSSVRVTASGREQECTVAALSQALLRLAREMAAELPPLLTP